MFCSCKRSSKDAQNTGNAGSNYTYTRPASVLFGNVAAVSVPRLLRRLFEHIHVADFGTAVAAGLGVFSHETPQGLERLRPLHLCMQDQKPVRSSETNFRAAAKAWMDEHRQSRNGTSLGVLSRVWEAGGFLKANCNCVECVDCKLGRGQSFRLEWNQDAAEPDTVRLRIFSSGVPST